MKAVIGSETETETKTTLKHFFVICPVCGKKFLGRVPANEISMYPRRHYQSRFIKGKYFSYYVKKVCPGSYRKVKDNITIE